jgi:hypothetical protein
MPFTPFHFGPGAAIKAAIPRHFSFTVFCFAQVVTDCETAYYMVQRVYPWHRFCHTYVGATLVGLFSVLVGCPVCQLTLQLWSAWRAAPFRRCFPRATVIPYRSAAAGAFIGTYSHVLLDSIVHDDVRPFWPFTEANPFYGVVGSFTLHAACVILGLFGAIYIVIAGRNA